MYVYPYGDSQQLNLDWIINKIKELEAAGVGLTLEEVSNALISLTYNTDTLYARFDYSFHNGKLYRCLSSTSGTFDPDAWQEALIGDDLAVLTRWINALNAAAVVDVKFDTSGTNGKIQQKYNDVYHDVVEVDYTPVQDSKRPLSSNAGYDLNAAISNNAIKAGHNLAWYESGNTASRAFTKGQYVIVDGNLYKVISNITYGDTYIVNTNIEPFYAVNVVLGTVQTPTVVGTHFELVTYDTQTIGGFCYGTVMLKCVVAHDGSPAADATDYVQMPFTRAAYGFQLGMITAGQWDRSGVTTVRCYLPTTGRILLPAMTVGQYITIVLALPVILN